MRSNVAPILEVRDLVKSFGGLRAVDRCSFRVGEGRITGLIGPNGAGKTTLFNLITGFLHPDAGRVLFRGQDVTGRAPHQIFRHGICRTFQIPREFREMTVLENLMLVPSDQIGERLWAPWFAPARVRRQEMRNRDKALGVLAFVGLLELRDEYARALSGGQKKLLELARAMMADPDLLLLDEPGAGVNPTLMKSLVQYIRRIVDERGVTVLLIEHDMNLVMTLCNPIIVMAEGRPLLEGPPQTIRTDPRVLDAYLGGKFAWPS
jgi:branched-chain amino acid transport system ATP-binding protein